MQWSYSSLKDFENCARRYHEIRILKNFKREETEQTLYGHAVHKAAELYVKNSAPFPAQFQFLQPFIDTLLKKRGVKCAEHEMALTKDLEPCEWDSPDAWVRGIADLLILDEEDHIAWLVDYKTGKDKNPDKGQLDLLSLLIFAHFPEIYQVNSALVFVVKDNFIKHKRYMTEIDTLWWEYRTRLARLEKAYAADVWNPTQSGLCRRHCAVLTCEFNGRT